MDAPQIQRVKTLLEIRQHELCLSIEQQRQSARRAESEPDAIDQAVSSSEKEALHQRSNREKGLLLQVEAALDRIRDGSFGQCHSCGNEIAGVRLEAVPWTRYCIQCQEGFEW